MNDKELYQADLDLCEIGKCFRFDNKDTPKCSNCPYVNKDKGVAKHGQ